MLHFASALLVAIAPVEPVDGLEPHTKIELAYDDEGNASNGGNWARPFVCRYSRKGVVRSESRCHMRSPAEPTVWVWDNGNVATVTDDMRSRGTWNGQPARFGYQGDWSCYTIDRTAEQFCVTDEN